MRVLAILMAAMAVLLIAAPHPAVAQNSGLGVVSAAGTPSVSGTTWQGWATWMHGESNMWTLFFREDGVLVYAYDGNTFDNGRWTQHDKLLTFHANNYFSIYAGVVNGGVVSGTMYNRRGGNGVFSFVRE